MTNMDANHSSPNYENSPKGRVGLGCSTVAVLLLAALVAGIALLSSQILDIVNRSLPPEASLLATAPTPDELAVRKASTDAQLENYQWVDENLGVAQIPIERAMALIVDKGPDIIETKSERQTPTEEAAVVSETATPAERPATASGIVTFDHVLPIFIERCAECHGEDEPEEGLVLTDYESVLAGSDLGSVVKPGDPESSYLVEQIVTGKMPKRADDLPQEEIDLIVEWIRGGAPEGKGNLVGASDGTITETLTSEVSELVTDSVSMLPSSSISTTSLLTNSAAPTHTVTATRTVVPLTGVDAEADVSNPRVTQTDSPATNDEVDLSNVSFQNDVLPIFENRCAKCHSEEDPEEGLILMSYEDVMAGSDLGSVVKPGDPEGSYLFEQIVTGKMPKRADDLPQEEIDIIRAWIGAGAEDN